MKKLYLTDLNPSTTYGLNHELWCIVDALMIGHATGRNIMVTGFYPDYNSKFKIDLGQVIDLVRTNEMLTREGFSVQLEPYNVNIRWTKSRYQNPCFRHFDTGGAAGKDRFFNMIRALSAETAKNVDLYTTFVWPLMHPYGYDKDLSDMSTHIFLCLVPSSLIDLCVQQRKKDLGLAVENDDDFLAIHMRLEDDWVTHLTLKYGGTPHFGKTEDEFSREMFDQIKSGIAAAAGDAVTTQQQQTNGKIFVATGLGKTSQKNNYLLDELRDVFGGRICVKMEHACEWKDLFLGMENNATGREIEGFIDFLICLRAKRAILATYSSFSVSLKYCRDLLGLKSVLYQG